MGGYATSGSFKRLSIPPSPVRLLPAWSPAVRVLACEQENTSLSASVNAINELGCCDTGNDTVSVTDPLNCDVDSLVAFHALHGLALDRITYCCECWYVTSDCLCNDSVAHLTRSLVSLANQFGRESIAYHLDSTPFRVACLTWFPRMSSQVGEAIGVSAAFRAS